MKPIHFWERISRSGLHSGLDAELERKVILCNQIGASAGFALFAGAAGLAARGHMVLAPFMVAFSLLYLVVLDLNRRGHHTFSRVYLCALPPLLVTLLAGLVLYRDSTFKFAMIPTILVPILVFGITERIRMLAGIACMVAAFLMMDAITPWIPRLEGVTISDEEITQNAIINGLITFFTFSASFVYLQRLNQKAEQALSESLQEVRAQKEIIERQKREDQVIASLALERQREANAMKSTFVAMTSHEFRTPLAAILSAQELLRDFGDRITLPERDELFVVIHASVQRMTGMLDKVLILSQADAEMMEFKPRLLNISDFCRQLVREILQPTKAAGLHAPRVALQLQLPDGELARMDESLLRHGLGNLLSNAIKYSPEGAEVVLAVSKKPAAMQFDVIDQGIGVPEQDLPLLFDPFHRASNVEGIPGTGLGLAIVKRAVERHGGTIEVDTAIGRGTRFRVLIPHG